MMVATFGDLKDRVARDLEPYLGRLNGDEIGQAVLDAIEHHADQPFWFLDHVSTGLATTALQASDDLPADLIKLDTVTLQQGDDDFPLEPLPWDIYREWQTTPSATTGQPNWYSFYQSKIWWYTTPDQAYPYTLYYRRRLPVLADDDDTSDWITYGWRMLRQSAKYELAIGPLELEQKAMTWFASAEDFRRALARKSTDRMVLNISRARDF